MKPTKIYWKKWSLSRVRKKWKGIAGRTLREKTSCKFYGIKRLSWDAREMWQIGEGGARLREIFISQKMLITYLIDVRHCGGCWEIVGAQDPWT